MWQIVQFETKYLLPQSRTRNGLISFIPSQEPDGYAYQECWELIDFITIAD